MFGSLIVPTDGSERAASAFDPAFKIAAALHWPVQIISFHGTTLASMDGDDRRARHLAELQAQIDRSAAPEGLAVNVEVRPRTHAVGIDLLEWAETQPPGALVCMASHGRGRSEALLGSVAEHVLHNRRAPTLLVGPAYRPDRFRPGGPVLVPLDGERQAEEIIPVAKTWAIAFDSPVEFIQAIEPAEVAALATAVPRERGIEANYLHRMTAEQREGMPHAPSSKLLQDNRPAEAIVRRARDIDAGIIAMTTEGATGAMRLIEGSTMAAVVRTSEVPVLTQVATA